MYQNKKKYISVASAGHRKIVGAQTTQIGGSG